MATSSITRSITIKNARQCKALVSAFERAQKCAAVEPPISKTVHEMTPDVMLNLFAQERSATKEE